MIDAITHERIRIQGEALTGSHILVPAEQLDAVRAALVSAGVGFWTTDRFIRRGEGALVTFIKLSRSSDTAAVQAMLDAI